MKILLVEDEEKISNTLKKGFDSENIFADQAFDGEDALDLIKQQTFDVIVLDIMLPKISGIQVCKIIREKQINTPIIMLTAKAQEEDIIAGLNAGADDYLTKPFSFNELLARVRALNRRPKENLNLIIVYKNIKVKTDTKEVYEKNKLVNLTKKEYLIFELLMINKGRVVSKDKILDEVWGLESEALPNNVEVYINYLRKKFKKNPIKTVRGYGYKID